MKYLFVLIIAITILPLSIAESAELSVESSNIESAVASSPENVTANITLINESQENTLNNYGIIEVFKLEMPYYERVEFSFQVDEDSVQNYIDRNPDLYNGPGHEYDPGLISLIKEENKQLINVRNVNGSLKSTLTSEGTYYLVIAPTSEVVKTYVNQEGECLQLVEKPNDNYKQVDSCSNTNWTLIIIVLLICGGIAFSAYIGYRKLKQHYLIKKLSSLTDEIERNPANEELLRDIYEAMEDVNDGRYKEASRLIDEIEREK